MAIGYRILGIDQALAMPDGPQGVFKRHWIGIFGWWQAAYLPGAVCDLVLGTAEAASIASNELAAFGRHLLAHPKPPWIIGEPDAWSEFLWGHTMEQHIPRPRPEPITYLGAAAALLIATEGMKTRILPDQGPHRFGPLADLYPYIECRWRTQPCPELPILSIPAPFQQTFHNWANNEIGFVHATSRLNESGTN